ncbi:Centrosomal protein of 44 kDa [Phytophthora pseudosyringae]|uniref:Centrosomal protein of 44 kDa n=1 Tax=Phytophthora pseudosyringae TaxID=221518 RepID=A0A8T1W0U7_9STRA|nr:Centrosomal protein of 44 kDa [Phytophthora pseudosyringae]
MSEQDVRNAAERLRKLLRVAQYPELRALRLEAGAVSDLLRVLHFVLLDSSRAVAQFLADRGYDLYGKTDARFVESAFRLLRDEFRCFPSLSAAQFLTRQFVARRLAIVADAAAAVAQKRQELQRAKRRDEAVWAQPQESSRRREIKPTVENHVLPTAVANHAASILQHLKVQPTADGGRRVRRASSGTPVQINGTGRDGGSVAAPPAPVFTTVRQAAVRFAAESRRRVSEDGFAVDDGVQTDSRSPPPELKACSCSQDSDKLAAAIADLSRQLGEMSSALVGKMISVENRLGRLENQMHDVRAAVVEEREFASKLNSVHITRTAGDVETRSDSELLKAAGLTNTRETLGVESPCSWPPQPSVFERY